MTSQLFNQYKYHSEQTEPLSITLFDPTGIGGRVWRTDQSDELIMNSAADQITLFTDASVNMSSKVYDGPSCLNGQEVMRPISTWQHMAIRQISLRQPLS